MRVMGIDPSSAYCGVVTADIGPRGGVEFRRAELYSAPAMEKDDHCARARSMWSFQDFLYVVNHDSWNGGFGTGLHGQPFPKYPELVTIERIHVAQNTNTVRLISYYEAAAMLWAYEHGAYVLLIGASTARSLVLPAGWGRSKEQIYEPFLSLFGGHLKWPEPDKEERHLDVIDAAILAVAGPKWMKREGKEVTAAHA